MEAVETKTSEEMDQLEEQAEKANKRLEDARNQWDQHNREVMALKGIRKYLGAYNSIFQKRVLLEVLSEVSQVTDRAEKLAGMESRIREIYNKLDKRTMCMLGILEEISAVDGCSVGVEYGGDILYGFRSDDTILEGITEELEADADLVFLFEAYELAKYINKAC